MKKPEATVLVKYEKMCRAIAECVRIDEAKEIRDKAMALAVYAKQAKNFKAEKEATKIRLRAERRADQLLTDMSEKGERAKVGDNQHGSNEGELPPKLADLRITKKQSAEWQSLAKIPDDTFEKFLEAEARPTGLGVIDRYRKQEDPYYYEKEHWKGMPEFVQQDRMSKRTIYVHFYKPEDVEAFAKLVGQKIGPKTKSINFPWQPRESFANKRWVDADPNLTFEEARKLPDWGLKVVTIVPENKKRARKSSAKVEIVEESDIEVLRKRQDRWFCSESRTLLARAEIPGRANMHGKARA